MTRSQRSASPASCVISTNVAPVSVSRSNNSSTTASPVASSRLPVGSSAKISAGRAAIARDRVVPAREMVLPYLTRAAFEAHGAGPFKYATRKGEVTTHKFYSAPEFLLDDPEQLLAWSRRAIQAAA